MEGEAQDIIEFAGLGHALGLCVTGKKSVHHNVAALYVPNQISSVRGSIDVRRGG